IAIRELGFARPARTGSREYQCSQTIPGAGIGQVRIEIPNAILLVLDRRLKFPAQSKIQGQLRQNFPAILSVQSPRTHEERLPGLLPPGGRVHVAEQETGDRESRVLNSRLPGLLRREGIVSQGADGILGSRS